MATIAEVAAVKALAFSCTGFVVACRTAVSPGICAQESFCYFFVLSIKGICQTCSLQARVPEELLKGRWPWRSKLSAGCWTVSCQEETPAPDSVISFQASGGSCVHGPGKYQTQIPPGWLLRSSEDHESPGGLCCPWHWVLDVSCRLPLPFSSNHEFLLSPSSKQALSLKHPSETSQAGWGDIPAGQV